MKDGAVGIFDSGVGGFSVVVQIAELLPHEPLIYYADSGRAPWGVRTPEEIQRFSSEITRFLIDQGAKIIVVACNTASVHALASLRAQFPEIAFVGMVPAVKPAAQYSSSKKVAVLATAATIRCEVLTELVDKFARPSSVEVVFAVPHGLVELIEHGEVNSETTVALLEKIVLPLLDVGVDTLVLGCSHYPFAADALRRVVNGRAHFIDPAPAIAGQCARVLESRDLLCLDGNRGGLPSMRLFTSGDVTRVSGTVEVLTGVKIAAEYRDVVP